MIGDKIPDKIYINKLLDDKKEVLKKKHYDNNLDTHKKYIESNTKPPIFYIKTKYIEKNKEIVIKKMINVFENIKYNYDIVTNDIIIDNIKFKLSMCIEGSFGVNGIKIGGHYIFSYFTKPFIQISDESIRFNDNNQNSHLKNGVLYVYERIDYVPDKLEQSMKELQEQVKDDPILKSYQDYLIKEHEKFMKS